MCLNPAKIFVKNISHDSSGDNCGNSNSYKNNNLNLKESIEFTRNIKEKSIAVFKIKEFYLLSRESFYKKIKKKLLKLL